MGEICYLDLFFNSQENLDEKEKEFLKALEPNIRTKGQSGIVIDLANTYFNPYKKKEIGYGKLSLSSVTSLSELHGKKLNKFLEIVGKAASKVYPRLAYWNITGVAYHEILLQSGFEYYSEPYFFCLEPRITDPSTDSQVARFIFDKQNLDKIEEIKKELPKDELLAILKKHSEKLILGQAGVGIIKELGHDSSYTRYFVRKAVREKNIYLQESFTELVYYDYHINDNPEKYSKSILNIVKDNLDEKSIGWKQDIQFALCSSFLYKPKEALEIFEKFKEKNKSSYSEDLKSVEEKIVNHYFGVDKKRDLFLQKLIEWEAISKEDSEKIVEEYEEAIQRKEWGNRFLPIKKLGDAIRMWKTRGFRGETK